MAQVASAQIKSDVPQLDGRRYVTYEFVVEDNSGILHTFIQGPKLVPSDFDANADLSVQGDLFLQHLISQDVTEAISSMEKGINPLRDSSGNVVVSPFADYNTIVAKALRYFLSHEDPAVAIMALPYIDNLTDDQIMALLPCDSAMVTDIRSLADSWRSTRDNITAYTPLLQE